MFLIFKKVHEFFYTLLFAIAIWFLNITNNENLLTLFEKVSKVLAGVLTLSLTRETS